VVQCQNEPSQHKNRASAITASPNCTNTNMDKKLAEDRKVRIRNSNQFRQPYSQLRARAYRMGRIIAPTRDRRCRSRAWKSISIRLFTVSGVQENRKPGCGWQESLPDLGGGSSSAQAERLPRSKDIALQSLAAHSRRKVGRGPHLNCLRMARCARRLGRSENLRGQARPMNQSPDRARWLHRDAREIVAELPSQQDELARKYWPGPLTFASESSAIPDFVTAVLPTVAFASQSSGRGAMD